MFAFAHRKCQASRCALARRAGDTKSVIKDAIFVVQSQEKIMLYNRQGQEIKVDHKFNSKEHPRMFKHLVEVKDPLPPAGKMFRIEERARFKQ